MEPHETTVDRSVCAAMYGPSTSDRVRLGDTDLIVQSEADDTSPGDEILGGCGKTFREGLLAAGAIQCGPPGPRSGPAPPSAGPDERHSPGATPSQSSSKAMLSKNARASTTSPSRNVRNHEYVLRYVLPMRVVPSPSQTTTTVSPSA